MSGFPSPLKSPVETEYGLVPVVKSVLGVKEGCANTYVGRYKPTRITTIA